LQKQIGCCISPPRLLLHRLGVSSRSWQGIHTTLRPGSSESEASSPSPLVARAAWALRGARETECSVRVSIRTSRH
jgi:hypothetical protein